MATYNIITENFIGYKGSRLFGGGERVLWELSQVLTSMGHRVVVTQVGDRAAEFTYENIAVRQVQLKDVSRSVNHLGITRRFHVMGLHLPRLVSRGADRIHLHYHFFGWLHGSPEMTGMSHGVEWGCPAPPGRPVKALRDRLSSWTMRRLAVASLKRIGKVIANDFEFAKWARAAVPESTDRIVRIPNFVDLMSFSHVPSSKSPSGLEFTVVYPKMLTRERGIHILLDALAQLPTEYRVRLLVCGHPPEGFSMARRVTELRSRHSIEELGYVEHGDMPSILSAADMVIVPSICREGTALAALEALAIGRPLLLTSVGGMTELVIDGFNGYVCTPTAQGIAHTLARAFRERETWPKLVENGLKVAEAHSLDRWRHDITDFFRGCERA